ncbi:MAG TPA: HAMP domain-containing protein, partial [Candidatus Dormibacteraeota bacterium]|nr:HAMP domain-containing protein [Candidatus Dormibacteraeota bacterium]
MSTRVTDLRGDLQGAVRDLSANAVRQPPPARRTPAATPSPSPAAASPTAPVNPTTAEIKAVTAGRRCSSVSSAVVARVASFLATRTSVVSGQSVSVAVYDANLNVIGAHFPASLSALPRLSSTALGGALAGRESAAQVIDNASGEGQLVVAFPVHASAASRAPACLAAQLGTPMALVDDVLTTDRNALLLGGGAVLILALLAGLWVTERALGPLHRVTDTAGRLAAGDLRARSRLPERGDEVGTLARAFDDMADRIEVAFAAQAESEAR